MWTVVLDDLGTGVRGRTGDGHVSRSVELPAAWITGVVLQVGGRPFQVLEKGVWADRQINQWLVVFAHSLGVIAIRSAINGECNANANGHELRAASTADHCGH